MKKLELFVAGTCKYDRFAVTCGPKLSIWYGKFFPTDKTYVRGMPETAERSAVEKAYWVGWKVAEGLGIPLRVIVHTSWRYTQDDFWKLEKQGRKKRVELYVVQVEADDNPARDLLRVMEYQKADLARACRCVETQGWIGSDL